MTPKSAGEKVVNKNGVVRMDWPSQSPDMNPLENVWPVLKANVAKHNDNIDFICLQPSLMS